MFFYLCDIINIMTRIKKSDLEFLTSEDIRSFYNLSDKMLFGGEWF